MKYILKSIFAIISLFTSCIVFGQISITGTILDIKTKEPIAGATIFINNTSYKTIADKDGNFALANINIQKGELIVNALGYKFKLINIEPNKTSNIVVALEQQAKELDAVVINSYEKDGYKKWGRLFVDNFIGYIAEAKECSIENEKVLRFYYDKKNQVLEVIATEPIKIKNNALGYEIEYTLETFLYYVKPKILSFGGYPVFTEMKGGRRKTKRWVENRKESYRGSIMHFMRSVFRNALEQEGFSIYAAKKVLNKEKARLKALTKERVLLRTGGVLDISSIYPADSTDYYQKIFKQEDSLFAIITKLKIDSIAYAIDSVTAGVFFGDYLMVNYNNKNIKNNSGEYSYQHSNPVQSYVKLSLPEELQIFANGNYYNSFNFFAEQYWASFEKAARLLPYDFIYKE